MKRNGSTIPVDDLFQHFKNINNPASNSENEPFLSNETINENHEINMPISENEIRQAAKNLKRNKSPGFDQILNEHLLITLDCMLPTLALYENATHKSLISGPKTNIVKMQLYTT